MQMVSLTPEVIIAGGAAPTRALQQATHTIPIIITQGGDVAANGLVKDIAHPEGNITGFTQFRADDRRKVAGTAQSGRAERRQSRDRRHNRRRKRKPRRGAVRSGARARTAAILHGLHHDGHEHGLDTRNPVCRDGALMDRRAFPRFQPFVISSALDA